VTDSRRQLAPPVDAEFANGINELVEIKVKAFTSGPPCRGFAGMSETIDKQESKFALLLYVYLVQFKTHLFSIAKLALHRLS